MRERLLAPAALFVAASITLTGCGGGGSRRVASRQPPPPAAGTGTGTGTTTAAPASNVAKKPIDKSTLGTIEVTVIYAGDPKKNKKVKMGSDANCVSDGEAESREEKFIRNANNSMANAVVHLSQGWDQWEVDDAKDTVLMDQKGCKYVPHVASVQTKQSIEFKNSDPTLHNIHPKPKKNKEMNKATSAGASITHAFKRPELGIPVKCDVHPWMRSYISVFKHPWHAVTPEGDGKASIFSVPAGKYKVRSWHEALGESKEVEVMVTAGKTSAVTINL